MLGAKLPVLLTEARWQLRLRDRTLVGQFRMSQVGRIGPCARLAAGLPADTTRLAVTTGVVTSQAAGLASASTATQIRAHRPGVADTERGRSGAIARSAIVGFLVSFSRSLVLL